MDTAIYIITVPNIQDRLDYLIPALNNYGMSNIQIRDGCIELSDEDLNKATDDVVLEEERASVTSSDYVSTGSLKTKKNMLSSALSHINIWNEIAVGEDMYAIILADSAVLDNNFSDIWDKLKLSFPTDLDVGYIYSGCSQTIDMFNIDVSPDTFWYNIEKKFGRTQFSYIISKEFCIRLVQDIYPIALPIDWEMNYLQNKLNANVYWTSIDPFFEGSGTKYMNFLK